MCLAAVFVCFLEYARALCDVLCGVANVLFLRFVSCVGVCVL